MGFRFRVVWGRRRESRDTPAPALPDVDLNNGHESPHAKYPLYEEYHTKEEALAAAAIRNQGKDIPPAPLVFQATESYF